MRSRFTRHLQSVLLTKTASPPAMKFAARLADAGSPLPLVEGRRAISPEFNGHQYMIFLLHVDAGIEHCLMAQYLYAAYTLGGPHVAEKYRELVESWQETILGIAKEEMGHLITVQNVLRLLSGPISFDREDFPYDAAFYPFDFTLERLTLDSLAKYIYAEMPEDWRGPLAREVQKRAKEANHDAPLHAVSELFALMIQTLSDPLLVPDEFFRPETVPQQASWNEWGRGYAHGARGSLHSDTPKTPDLIIRTVDSRASAVAALQAIAEQGEATTMVHAEASHFERFLKIYVQWSEILKKDKAFDPSRRVVTNPVVEDALPVGAAKAKISMKPDERNVITHPVTFYWAHLLNVRYRLLLSALTHALHLTGKLENTKQPTARGDVITLVFSEMYKIRSIASVLVQLPVHTGVPVEKAAAGPPFQMPYTLDLPQEESDRWRWYRDMLIASGHILDVLAQLEDGDRRLGYVAALKESDALLLQTIRRMIGKTDERLAEVTT